MNTKKILRTDLQQLVFLGIVVAMKIILSQFSFGPVMVKVGLGFIGIIINALNEFRNKVLEEGKDSEPIDEILLKVLEAPDKKRMFPRKYVDER